MTRWMSLLARSSRAVVVAAFLSVGFSGAAVADEVAAPGDQVVTIDPGVDVGALLWGSVGVVGLGAGWYVSRQRSVRSRSLTESTRSE